MKNTKKWISVLLVAMLLISTVVATGVSVSAASGTLTHYYSTNGSGYGKEKTITVDGDISDWDSSMLIAQGTANDDPRVYRPNSMYELAEDLYALYAAYDSSNLYLMWEMTNVQDVVSPLDNYPLTQGILYETSEFPLFIFIDTGKSADAIGNQGKTNTGGTLWDKHITTDNSFNRVIATDVKGNNGPWVYGGDASGVNPVEMYNRTTSGITVKYGKGILSQQVNGINKGHGTNNNRVPGDVCNESAEWVNFNTLGHTSSIYLNVATEQEKLAEFQARMKTCRIVVNTPSSHGGIGDLYNFALAPSLTLGCGSWGGNSVSENVGVKHLLNIKTVVERRENMLWFRSPEKIYIKKGCLPVALNELKEMGKKRAFIVTGPHLYKTGAAEPVFAKLTELGIQYTCFFDVPNDPTLACAKRGAEQMASFKPDTIIAIGGGSPMDAAKIMWVLYEHPEADFADMAMRFSDIRKRIYKFPKMGEKAYFICVPTSAGTGSEVTPFAVITDETTNIKYPLADYELMPNMAIVDVDYHMTAPKGLTASSGIDAVSHALEAYASVMATDYTDGIALRALKNLFTYLPRAYEDGQDVEAREKVANAATMAGMAFANAFLGVMHSMAHKLGAFHHIAHGLANALMMDEVIRFNSSEAPTKMGTFPQYDHPHALARYAEIADYLGCGGRTDQKKVENLIKKIDELKAQIGIKPTIRDYVPDEEAFLSTLDEMVEQAFDDQCTGANPRYPLMSEIKQMYLNAYYGKIFTETPKPDEKQLERR